MSDAPVTDPNLAGAGAGELSAGLLLRQAREASGLHIGALAVAMKVPVKKLEALEADRLEELPDAVFVRALAASMCRTLKVDPAQVLALLPQSVAPRLDKTDRGVRMPVQGSGFLAGNAAVAFVSKPSVLLVAALLVGALVVAFFPQARSTVGLEDSVAQPKAEPQAQVAPAMPEGPQQAPAVPVIAPMAEPAPAPVPAKLASGAATPEAGAEPAGLLVFKAKSRAWVRVSDSRGVVQFEKTLDAGESAVASGTPPLSVVVGNVAATEVLLRGQPFQMQDLNQNNVARFEVK